MDITNKMKAIVLEAAKKSNDPVLIALNKLGFRERGSNGRKKCLRYVSPGPGYTITSFIDNLNYILSKERGKGDRMFSPPGFNGFYACSNATYHGTAYSMEIGVGSVVLTVTTPGRV